MRIESTGRLTDKDRDEIVSFARETAAQAARRRGW